jgi:hypothetical protein
MKNECNFVSMDFITWEEIETTLRASKYVKKKQVWIGLMLNCYNKP